MIDIDFFFICQLGWEKWQMRFEKQWPEQIRDNSLVQGHFSKVYIRLKVRAESFGATGHRDKHTFHDVNYNVLKSNILLNFSSF